MDDADAGAIEEISLTLPARVPYARVARLAITGLASRAGFSYDEIEDLRIAVGEVCGLLMDDGAGRLAFHCRVGHGALEVEAVREPAGLPLEVSTLSDQILHAVTNEVSIDHEGGRVRVAKRHQA